MSHIFLLLSASVLSAPGETVLLSFGNGNCPHCREMEPTLAKLESLGLPIRRVNVDQEHDAARTFRITAIPTYIMLVNGRETDRAVGTAAYDRLAAMFPQRNAPPPVVRGQSPETASASRGNYLGESIGRMFGGGKPKEQPRGVSGDPFAQRQAETTNESNVHHAVAPAAFQQEASRESSPAAQDRAAASAVKITVIDNEGKSLGSGTIVDLHGEEALIVTCGHIFRTSKGKGEIEVDLFYPEKRKLQGTLIDYDLERDIGLIAVSDAAGAIAAPIAGKKGTRLAKGDAVFSLGCDRGAEPTLRDSRVTAVNRYVGPPNIEAAGAPVDGRSGGGLFDAAGRLIGVCNAADPQDDEGIYAGTETIHGVLEKSGLSEIIRETPAANAFVSTTAPKPHDDSCVGGACRAPAALEAVPQFAGGANEHDDKEIICIVRSRSNPAAKNEIHLLDRAPPDLLRSIAESSAKRNSAAGTRTAEIASRPEPPRTLNRAPLGQPGQVFRGQSLDR